MEKFINNLKKKEKISLMLRKHYEQYGYKKVRLNKFEDYELYNENKAFIKDENIITFMDLNGKLQALRPDVTLSIVKKYIKDSKKDIEKLYYIENIYRISREDREYKELNQIGVEVLGELDEYSNFEILNLAMESLEIIDKEYILDISHINFLSGLFEEIGLDYETEREVLKSIYQKNVHDMEKILDKTKIKAEFWEKLVQIPNLSGKFDETIKKAEKLVINRKMKNALEELKRANKVFNDKSETGRVLLDFSIVNNLDYYNGLIFHGYIKDNPKVVLSGGNYDKLVKKSDITKGAIGFAVYLDELNGNYEKEKEYDFDILILYKSSDSSKLLELVKEYTTNGYVVRTEKFRENFESNFNYKKKYIFENNKLIGKE